MKVVRAPGGELSVRERGRRRGGQVVPLRVVRGSVDGIVNLTIFVHGYNNDVRAARQSYRAHTQHLRRQVGAPKQQGIFWLFWPGDTGKWRWISSGSYPWMIDNAKQTGQRLAEFFSGLTTPGLRVRLIAHSLGNRVVLEALRALDVAQPREPTGLGERRVHLMAAAVPTIFCEDTGDFTSSRSQLDEHVSWSTRDAVLRFTFPPGELFETHRWSEAVGRRGNPRPRWGSREDSKLGHGDYWADRNMARKSARIIVGARAVLGPPTRNLAQRELRQRLLLDTDRL